ncbi:uncharacterized protein LOC101853740 [Aplysia californica]|uniref:Uncharacterized protein LOC101853740 n=1 Tax=Aplysia californica TaxID=6500 RepID=A0ABM1W2E2_APLCA|nr:uncharacterized protein LOC101853740 [Aplysia californica]
MLLKSSSLESIKLLDWEKEHGRIPDRAAVVFHFDWSKKFLQPQEYAGSKDIGNLFSFRHPAVSEAAGMWLADERNIKMIATDTLTPDPLGLTKRQITTLPIHVRYSKEKRLIVENLKDTGKLPPRGFRLFAVPYKFDGASGAPTRTFAITHDELGTGGASVLSASLFGVFLSVWTLYLLIH